MSSDEKKCKLYISHNCGISYSLAHQTDEEDDIRLMELVNYADGNMLRYYVTIDNEMTAFSAIHLKTAQALAGINELGYKHCSPYTQRSIEDQASLLADKFGAKKRNNKQVSS